MIFSKFEIARLCFADIDLPKYHILLFFYQKYNMFWNNTEIVWSWRNSAKWPGLLLPKSNGLRFKRLIQFPSQFKTLRYYWDIKCEESYLSPKKVEWFHIFRKSINFLYICVVTMPQKISNGIIKIIASSIIKLGLEHILG